MEGRIYFLPKTVFGIWDQILVGKENHMERIRNYLIKTVFGLNEAAEKEVEATKNRKVSLLLNTLRKKTSGRKNILSLY